MHNQSDLKTEEERKISQDASSLFGRLLDDLKTRNMLRKTASDERRRLLSVFDNTGRLQDAFNEMTKQYGKDRFAEFKKKTELSEKTLIYSFLSQAFSTLLICYETPIKLPLVFFLDEKSGITKRMALGKVLEKLAYFLILCFWIQCNDKQRPQKCHFSRNFLDRTKRLTLRPKRLS